jgi:hypothetical protein
MNTCKLIYDLFFVVKNDLYVPIIMPSAILLDAEQEEFIKHSGSLDVVEAFRAMPIGFGKVQLIHMGSCECLDLLWDNGHIVSIIADQYVGYYGCSLKTPDGKYLFWNNIYPGASLDRRSNTLYDNTMKWSDYMQKNL